MCNAYTFRSKASAADLSARKSGKISKLPSHLVRRTGLGVVVTQQDGELKPSIMRWWVIVLSVARSTMRGWTSSLPRFQKQHRGCREAVVFLEESAFTVGELNAYDAYLDSIRVEGTRINESLKAGRKQGRQEGLEKGEQIGLEKAPESLVSKGVIEAEARNMLGLPHATPLDHKTSHS